MKVSAVLNSGLEKAKNILKNAPANAKKAVGYIGEKIKLAPQLAKDTFDAVKKQPVKSAGIAVAGGLALFGLVKVIEGIKDAVKANSSK